MLVCVASERHNCLDKVVFIEVPSKSFHANHVYVSQGSVQLNLGHLEHSESNPKCPFKLRCANPIVVVKNWKDAVGLRSGEFLVMKVQVPSRPAGVMHDDVGATNPCVVGFVNSDATTTQRATS